MHAYQTDASHFQPNHQAPSVTVGAWIKSKLQARRVRLALARDIGQFQEPGALADMGIDDTAAGGTLSSLAKFSPHVIAVNIFAR